MLRREKISENFWTNDLNFLVLQLLSYRNYYVRSFYDWQLIID